MDFFNLANLVHASSSLRLIGIGKVKESPNGNDLEKKKNILDLYAHLILCHFMVYKYKM